MPIDITISVAVSTGSAAAVVTAVCSRLGALLYGMRLRLTQTYAAVPGSGVLAAGPSQHLQSFIKICSLLAFIKWISSSSHPKNRGKSLPQMESNQKMLPSSVYIHLNYAKELSGIHVPLVHCAENYSKWKRDLHQGAGIFLKVLMPLIEYLNCFQYWQIFKAFLSNTLICFSKHFPLSFSLILRKSINNNIK